MRAASRSFSSRAFAAISFAASNSSRVTTSRLRRIFSAWAWNSVLGFLAHAPGDPGGIVHQPGDCVEKTVVVCTMVISGSYATGKGWGLGRDYARLSPPRRLTSTSSQRIHERPCRFLPVPFPPSIPSSFRSAHSRSARYALCLYRRHSGRVVAGAPGSPEIRSCGAARSPIRASDVDDVITWVRAPAASSRPARLCTVLRHVRIFLQHPLEIFTLWHGGMSFHGGFLGTILALLLYARSHRISMLSMLDPARSLPPSACSSAASPIS